MPRSPFTAPLASLVAASMTLGGCAAGPAPANLSQARWAPGQDAGGTVHPQGEWTAPDAASAQASCTNAPLPSVPGALRVAPGELGTATLRLAPGDRLLVEILGDPDALSGTYAVGADGMVALGSIDPVDALGATPERFAHDLKSALVAAGLVRPLRNAVRVRLAEAGGVSVHVAGAVFNSGAVRPGERTPESRIGQKEGEASGDANAARTLSTALRAAGGLRPDADARGVILVRGDRYAVFDMAGLMTGHGANDPVLASGDRIIVPETGCFDAALVRPGPLTQPGIKVFMSNLTRSANNNAGAAINEKTGSLPYGTRMLQGLVAMNCVGGTKMQAGRRAILISRNPANGQSVVIERKIEQLVRSADRDTVDPYLMPGDALACYDSKWTNFREALGMVSDVAGSITPAIILQQAID